MTPTPDAAPTDPPPPRSVTRELVVGPIGWRHGEPPAAGDRYCVVALPPRPGRVNTTALNLDEVRASPLTLRRWGQQAPSTETAPARVLLDGLGLARRPIRLTDSPTRPSPLPTSWVPLFIVEASPDKVVTHSQVRLGGSDALFLRTGSGTGSGAGSASIEQSVSLAIDLHHRNRQALNNHESCIQKFWPDTEIELKLTLDGPVDIFGLAVDFRNRIGSPPLHNYIQQYGDDVQQWEFDNHLYEITHPEADAGYISLIPLPGDAAMVKRKWFEADSVRRRETHRREPDLTPERYPDYVTGLHAQAVYRGAFRRIRFDVNHEASRTGNIYSIIVDRCTPLDRTGPDLYQVELEYIHSRTLDRTSADHVDAEMAFLLQSVKDHLTRLAVTYTETLQSKLTYLRDLPDSPTAGRSSGRNSTY